MLDLDPGLRLASEEAIWGVEVVTDIGLSLSLWVRLNFLPGWHLAMTNIGPLSPWGQDFPKMGPSGLATIAFLLGLWIQRVGMQVETRTNCTKPREGTQVEGARQ